MKATFPLATLILVLTGCGGITESAACRSNLQCHAQGYIAQADVDCMSPVEKALGTDMKWDHAREREMVSTYKWKDKAKGTIAYFGEKALLKTPNGVERMKYECDFDPTRSSGHHVIGVRILKHVS